MDILANSIHFIFKNMKFYFSSNFGYLLQCMGFFFSLPSPAEAQNREEIAPRRIH